jgi:hypothetical protein
MASRSSLLSPLALMSSQRPRLSHRSFGLLLENALSGTSFALIHLYLLHFLPPLFLFFFRELFSSFFK